jgi:hypothetical protein
MDFEPKRREIYEAVSNSGEILGRSGSALNVRKSGTTGDSTEYASKIGAEVKGSDDSGTRTYGEKSWGGGTHVQEENVNTTDSSREKRETYSSTTNLTQMYELFTGYHLGSNRALFHMVSRPHTTEMKDQYTFVNGPRRLEGIQDVFLIVNRPKDQPGLCIETFLETAHLLALTAEDDKNDIDTVSQIPETTTHEAWGGNMGFVWTYNRAEGYFQYQELEVFVIPPGCELDITTNPQQTFQVGNFGNLPALTISVPPGIFLDFGPNTFWRSLHSVTMQVIAGHVKVKVMLRDGGGNWEPKFECRVKVYYKCTRMVDPPKQNVTLGNEQEQLFLTSRGLSTCVGLEMANENSQPGNISDPFDYNKILDPNNRTDLMNWLEKYQNIDLGIGPDDYREGLNNLIKEHPEKLKVKLRNAFNRGNSTPIPQNWLLADEWVSFETNIPVDPLMSNPSAPALQRIRSANDLTTRLGQKMLESLSSSERYADRTVDFWHTNMVLNHLSNEFLTSQSPMKDAKIIDLDIKHKEKILTTLGDTAEIKELLGSEAQTLRKVLGISETDTRKFKLELLKSLKNVSRAQKISHRKKS